MELTGVIKVIGETQTFGNNGFKKRELVITTTEEYPQMIPIEFVKDKEELLDLFSVGQKVKVGINLGGREWVTPEGVSKYFLSVKGWKIEETA